MTSRYTVVSSGGSQQDKPYAVIDNHDKQGGKGRRRMSFHRTFREAQAAARKLNEQENAR